MIRSKNGETDLEGSASELLADLCCVIATLSISTDISKRLISDTVKDGLEVAQIVENGGKPEDFFEEE